MTTAEVKYIVEDILNDSMDIVSPLTKLKYIRCSDLLMQDTNSRRYKFDSSTGSLSVYFCKEYKGEIPTTWVMYKDYDTVGDKTYKYIKNENGTLLENYYSFDNFECIAVRSEK